MQYNKPNSLPNYGTSSLPNDLQKPHDNLDLKEFVRTLVRRKRMIATITGVTLALILIATLLSTPAYRATATVQIEREPTRVVDIDFLGTNDVRDTRDFYQTQFELMRSRALAAQVIDDLKLRETWKSSGLKQWLGLGTTDEQTELENTLLDNLEIEPVKNSRVVAISYIGSTPEEAAKIANAVVKAFSTMNAKKRLTSIAEATSLLEKSAQETKAKLDEAQQKLSAYIRDKQIFQVDSETSNNNAQLRQLTNELTQIQNQRIAKETQITQLSPKENRIAQTLKNDIEALKGKENSLHATIADTKEKVLQEQDAEMEYTTLKREVAVNQTLYQNLLQRLKEASIASGVISNNVSIVDAAQPPTKKFKPNLLSNLIFGSLLGLLLGVAAAFLREFLDDTVHDVNKLERLTHLPVLGVIPSDKTLGNDNVSRASFRRSHLAVAEAFRTLRTTLSFQPKTQEHSILLITSTAANVGKSTVAANLAGTYARAGQKVLLIDADMRNPSLNKLVGVETASGLAEYLMGKTDSKSLILGTELPQLYFIAAGQQPEDPAETLNSARMHHLLESASREFDQVVIDSPPLAGLADSLVLASQATATLLVARAENTRIASITTALKRLSQAKATVLGILLNDANLAKANNYGYEYSDYTYVKQNQTTGNSSS